MLLSISLGWMSTRPWCCATPVEERAQAAAFRRAVVDVELAVIIAGELNLTVPVQAVDIFIANPDSYLVVAEYIGPVIPFGVTELPAGGSIRYLSLALDRVF